MFACEYLLAAALLIQPEDPKAASPELYTAVRLPLQTLAINWEILDPREVRYVLARPEDFSSDLALLRRRYQELDDAPSLCDGQRFPDRTSINDLLAFNRAFRQHIDVRQPGEPSRCWELRGALQETDHLYHIWDTVRDARCEYYYVTVRRQALKRLRDLLGEEAYYNAKLPPHVPVWRCQVVN
ncbi:MAG: hypothetical protein K2R98_23235 [Gemmataceae bacterium]|nr:hypothetical protein [Gemmataceae bacterium]